MTRALLALLIVVTATPAAGQERSFAIKRFDAAIVVNRDGSVDVTETITTEFTGSWNGIYRSVPVEYRTPQGFNWTLRLDFLGATDQNGTPLEVESGRERHYVKYKIRVPGAENATRIVLLRYRAKNGLRFFEDHDELYWNLTGDEWDVPLEAVTASIQLPPAAAGIRAIAFNGAYGSTARDAIYREPPRWYVGTNVSTFDLGGFSSRLSDLSSRAESAMTSSPRSSSGSGFSGGSSGGGSGGGGGGAW